MRFQVSIFPAPHIGMDIIVLPSVYIIIYIYILYSYMYIDALINFFDCYQWWRAAFAGADREGEVFGRGKGPMWTDHSGETGLRQFRNTSLSLVQVKRDCPSCTYVSPHRAQCLFNTGQTRCGEKHFPQTLQAFWREDREQTAVRILSLGQLYHALSCFIS